MFQPSSAWPRLALQAADTRWWRRPLILAVALGCMVSLITSGRLTLRLAAPATIYWSFVPLCEIGSLAVVWRRRDKIPLSRAIDLFFTGHGPWFLWLTAFAAAWAFLSPVRLFGWANGAFVWERVAWLTGAWSLYMDFWFFRRVFHRTPRDAARDLAVQRAICWGAALVVFVASAGWQVVASKLGI